MLLQFFLIVCVSSVSSGFSGVLHSVGCRRHLLSGGSLEWLCFSNKLLPGPLGFLQHPMKSRWKEKLSLHSPPILHISRNSSMGALPVIGSFCCWVGQAALGLMPGQGSEGQCPESRSREAQQRQSGLTPPILQLLTSLLSLLLCLLSLGGCQLPI